MKAGEIIASMLLTWHNLTFYQDLMARLRKAIEQKKLQAFTQEFASAYSEEEASAA